MICIKLAVIIIMKNYIKQHHLSLISILISLISLFGVITLNISTYSHKKKLEKENKENYLFSLNYYDEFFKIITNHDLDKPFSDIESKEMYYKLMSGCSYLTTNDINDDKSSVDLTCVSIVGNIYERLISFDSELKKTEILQELVKLKGKVNTLMQN